MAEQQHDPVNHPAHYTSSPARCSGCGKPIECIDITRHMGFNTGNAVKYIWRCDLKNDALEDLEKVAWYIQDEIAERKRKAAETEKEKLAEAARRFHISADAAHRVLTVTNPGDPAAKSPTTWLDGPPAPLPKVDRYA